MNARAMNATQSLLWVLLICAAFGAMGLGGCACTSRVPVSLEPLNDWLLYHGRCGWRYPYSCPCCPYVGAETVEADPLNVHTPEHPQPKSPANTESPPKR